MNWEAWKPLAVLTFTTVLKFVGGLLVAHGLATNGPSLEALGGAATTAAGAWWSWWVQKGHVVAGEWLKHLTDTATQAAAIEVAKRMSPASVTGAAVSAKAEVKAIEPAVMAKDAANVVAKILLVAFVLSAFLAGGSAHAQIKIKTPGQIVRDIQSAATGKPQQPTDATGNPIASLLSKPMQDLADFISAGFTEAVSLSTAVPELQDGNGQACWAMMNNYSAVLKAHPIPLTLHAAADLESIRLLNMAANKICQNAACTQVFTDAGNLVNAAMPIGMPLPNLTAICSKVPEIAIVTPTLPIAPLPVTPATSAPVATPPAQ